MPLNFLIVDMCKECKNNFIAAQPEHNIQKAACHVTFKYKITMCGYKGTVYIEEEQNFAEDLVTHGKWLEEKIGHNAVFAGFETKGVPLVARW